MKITKKINRFLFKNKLQKPLKYTFVIGMYLTSIYVIEYHFVLPLFIKLGLIYGIIKALEKLK